MADFDAFIQKEREELSRKRDELIRQKGDLDRQIRELDRKFAAVDAYERTLKGSAAAPSGAGGKRRTGIRQNVLGVIERHPDGITRAGILQEMRAKGDKRAEQSISNALSNLKKQGHVRLEGGSYTSA